MMRSGAHNALAQIPFHSRPTVSAADVSFTLQKYDTDRHGLNYHIFDPPDADPFLCRAKFAAELCCRGLAYVKPSVQRSNTSWWLKERGRLLYPYSLSSSDPSEE